MQIRKPALVTAKILRPGLLIPGLLIMLLFASLAQAHDPVSRPQLPEWSVLVLQLISPTHVVPVTGIVVSVDGMVLVPIEFTAHDNEMVVLDGGFDPVRFGRPAQVVERFPMQGLAMLKVEYLRRQPVRLSAQQAREGSETLLLAFPPAEEIAAGAAPVAQIAVLELDKNVVEISQSTLLPNVTGALVDACDHLMGISEARGIQDLGTSGNPVYHWQPVLIDVLHSSGIATPLADCSHKFEPPEPQAKPQPESQPVSPSASRPAHEPEPELVAKPEPGPAENLPPEPEAGLPVDTPEVTDRDGQPLPGQPAPETPQSPEPGASDSDLEPEEGLPVVISPSIEEIVPDSDSDSDPEKAEAAEVPAEVTINPPLEPAGDPPSSQIDPPSSLPGMGPDPDTDESEAEESASSVDSELPPIEAEPEPERWPVWLQAMLVLALVSAAAIFMRIRAGRKKASSQIIPLASPAMLALLGPIDSVDSGTWPLAPSGETVDLTIGRFDADITLPGDSVSRVHARLAGAPRGLRLTDLDSTNGTRINGRRLSGSESIPVAPGDEIAFGDECFTLTILAGGSTGDE